ncbi:RagB/SusD family nutrient uptake outer membrane protein [Chitinophaga sp. G-6-1-13]|uniref:RagB/SusD family nutrient uptake outer membrane protein n=1 Tax=Chitinophaga fulva TaxID=2728842 RepID=A0A848GHJ3_9BACT|nr:RagB/SusD family nutrient uptake outer membrane protein [Chitinophaga fulva]NML37287.1 RagB/SusD family nutrient uptake outer membrane protein [Chitinophaga fulva]
MNRIIKHIAVVCCAAALSVYSTSCNHMLDVKPTDQVDGEDIFKSLSTVNRAVLGVYAGWEPEHTLRIGSVMADECRIGLKNAGVNGSAQNLFRWAFSGGDAEISIPWTNAYQVINRANRILEGIDRVPVNNATEEQQKQQLRGELLAIRAFEHFELYRNYSYAGVYQPDAPAVPYVTSADINNKPTRPAAADFFRQLQSDLEAALIISGDRISDDVTRMHTQAIYALQARVALYTGNWTAAAENATRAIGKLTLASREEFPAIWTDKSNTEVIFKLKRTNLSTLRPGDIWKNPSIGIVYFAPSQKLLKAYDKDNDIRYSSYFDQDPALAADGQLADVVRKYAGEEGAENRNDVKVFRVSEMYLIRAEANMHLGKLPEAAADLNSIGHARIQGYEAPVLNNAQQLLKAILLERFRELPFEGHRYYDLKRLGLPVQRDEADLQQGDTQTDLLPSALYYYLPIPQSEILSNPNIKPNNKGW